MQCKIAIRGGQNVHKNASDLVENGPRPLNMGPQTAHFGSSGRFSSDFEAVSPNFAPHLSSRKINFQHMLQQLQSLRSTFNFRPPWSRWGCALSPSHAFCRHAAPRRMPPSTEFDPSPVDRLAAHQRPQSDLFCLDRESSVEMPVSSHNATGAYHPRPRAVLSPRLPGH